MTVVKEVHNTYQYDQEWKMKIQRFTITICWGY